MNEVIPAPTAAHVNNPSQHIIDGTHVINPPTANANANQSDNGVYVIIAKTAAKVRWSSSISTPNNLFLYLGAGIKLWIRCCCCSGRLIFL